VRLGILVNSQNSEDPHPKS